jgi:hypothetical protein
MGDPRGRPTGINLSRSVVVRYRISVMLSAAKHLAQRVEVDPERSEG